MTSEEKFLSEYRMEDYDRPSVTADVVTFSMNIDDEDTYRHNPTSKLSLLLIKRGEHPFLNMWALPGGFLRSSETIEECAMREITEETNITPASIMPIGVFSECDRDPRGRVISNAFVSIYAQDMTKTMGGYDASDAAWFDIEYEDNDEECKIILTSGDVVLEAKLKKCGKKYGIMQYVIDGKSDLAFDHAIIIVTALEELRKQAVKFDIIFDFLPEKFTLASLQQVQETIMNVSVVAANFRRKVADYVVETDEYTQGAGHRPAKLFMRK